MEMVLIFTFCLILAGTDAVTTVTGSIGQSVQIKCSYKFGYEENNKYLCRGKCSSWDLTDIPVQSGSATKDSRFSLYDDTTAKVFTVTITDLRTEDEGTYWCGIEQIGSDKYTEILLLVKMANSLSDANYQNTKHNVLNRVDYVIISMNGVLFAVGVIIAIYCKIKCQGSETVTQSSRETNENDQNLLPLQAREKVDLPESVCQSLELTTNQSDSVYQSLSLTNTQSDSVYHTLNITNYQ